MGRHKQEKTYPSCPICGKPMTTEYKCNFEQMTLRASWHLDFSPITSMCHDCSNSLLVYVNTWFANRNKTNQIKKFTQGENKDE